MCLAAALSGTTQAWAYNESGTVDAQWTECASCHPRDLAEGTNLPKAYEQGPHADYVTTSGNCSICHSIHHSGFRLEGGQPTSSPTIKLLPRQTIRATCEMCHDGTGGGGVYGAIAARGLTVGAQHRIDATNVVPGGDGATGGPAVVAFGGVAGALSCDDCHDPHDGGTVDSFVGDRLRSRSATVSVYASSKLLKKRPTSATTETADYGPDWCGACHKGRVSGSGMPNNHPVDSRLVTTTPFYYANVALLATDAPTSATVMGGMGGTQLILTTFVSTNGGNRAYLMPLLAGDQRTVQQGGHYPICQQCHEDSRNCGTLSADGLTADASPSVVTTTDGGQATDNPRFQNFPHETQNTKMLVEQGDDLCTNCHPAGTLP